MIKENFYFPLFVQSFFIQKNIIQKIRDNKNKMTFLQRVSWKSQAHLKLF